MLIRRGPVYYGRPRCPLARSRRWRAGASERPRQQREDEQGHQGKSGRRQGNLFPPPRSGFPARDLSERPAGELRVGCRPVRPDLPPDEKEFLLGAAANGARGDVPSHQLAFFAAQLSVDEQRYAF
jgi:hypothetical protein